MSKKNLGLNPWHLVQGCYDNHYAHITYRYSACIIRMDLVNNARCERLGGRPSGYWVIRIQSFPRRPPTGSFMQFFYSQAVLKLHWCVQFLPTLPLTDQMNYFFFAKNFPCRDSNQGSLGHTRSTTNLEAAPWTLSQGQLIHEVAKFQPWGISGVCDLFPSEGPAHHLGEGGGI